MNHYSTLLVLIDFSPVQSKLFTWSPVTKTFDILPEIIIEYQIQAFCTKNEDFDQIYLNTGSKTQNVEELSLDLIFYNNFW